MVGFRSCIPVPLPTAAEFEVDIIAPSILHNVVNARVLEVANEEHCIYWESIYKKNYRVEFYLILLTRAPISELCCRMTYMYVRQFATSERFTSTGLSTEWF